MGSEFLLEAAGFPDVPELAKISADSFLSDRHTQMKSLGAKPYDHENTMKEHLPQQMKSPNSILIKAVDASSGKIAGWVSWGFRGFDQTEITAIRQRLAVSSTTRPRKEDLDNTGAKPTKPQAIKDGAVSSNAKRNLVEELESMTSADLKSWMDQLMPTGTRCMFVISLCVAPKWQSRGAGSSLLKWGIEQADSAGVFIWVHSSEGAWPMYQRHGFEVVGSLDVDLDQYAYVAATNEKGESEKWGHYIFRYMKRLPAENTE